MAASSIKDALRQVLTDDAAVTALVAARIYNVTAPQNAVALPYVTFQRISEVEEKTLDGPSGLYRDRWQFDCYGNTRASVDAVGDAIYAALAGFRGTLGIIQLSSITLSNRSDLFESVTRLDRDSHDYIVWWSDPP